LGQILLEGLVKSLKTSVGSVVCRPEDVPTLLAEMQKFRGMIEGGVCVRRFETFLPGSELRFFVIRGVPYAATGAIPPIVHEVARRLEAPFFSVDIATREDGVPRVVEVGDGQVSDLVGWEPRQFAALWT
jgi:ATP-grasp domain, R2K clade family 3